MRPSLAFEALSSPQEDWPSIFHRHVTEGVFTDPRTFYGARFEYIGSGVRQLLGGALEVTGENEEGAAEFLMQAGPSEQGIVNCTVEATYPKTRPTPDYLRFYWHIDTDKPNVRGITQEMDWKDIVALSTNDRHIELSLLEESVRFLLEDATRIGTLSLKG